MSSRSKVVHLSMTLLEASDYYDSAVDDNNKDDIYDLPMLNEADCFRSSNPTVDTKRYLLEYKSREKPKDS